MPSAVKTDIRARGLSLSGPLFFPSTHDVSTSPGRSSPPRFRTTNLRRADCRARGRTMQWGGFGDHRRHDLPPSLAKRQGKTASERKRSIDARLARSPPSEKPSLTATPDFKNTAASGRARHLLNLEVSENGLHRQRKDSDQISPATNARQKRQWRRPFHARQECIRVRHCLRTALE